MADGDRTLTIEVDQDRTAGTHPSEWTIEAPQEISFGRAAEIVLGDNPYLHRSVGRFVHQSSAGWQIQNDGSRIVLDVRTGTSGNTGAPVSVVAGQSAPLPGATGTISFYAGSERYVLSFQVGSSGPESTPAVDTRQPGEAEMEEDRSIELVSPPLSRREQRVLLALSEPRLRRPDSERILVPSISQVASRVALSLPQVNDCVTSLTDHYRSLGSPEPRADTNGDPRPTNDASETHTLEVLVRWAVASRMVTTEQLESLNSPNTQMERRP